MMFKQINVIFGVLATTCLFNIQNVSTIALLERLNNLNGEQTTKTSTFESTPRTEYRPTEVSTAPIEAMMCRSDANNASLMNAKMLTEIRNVGATCNRQCDGAGGHHFSSELGEFSRRLQLLQVTVEGLALMLDETLETMGQYNTQTFLKSPYPKDCNEVQQRGQTTSGVYTIHPEGCGPPFQAYCDMETDGGGWTVFQRREDGSVNFIKGWGSYRRGFGDLLGEFWLGNDKLHRLSFQDDYELRVDLEAFNGSTSFAKYDYFVVGDVHANYRLEIGQYNGTAGDSLEYHNHLPFTTFDKDNDLADTNCAGVYSGGWWFNTCHYSNLNGRYLEVDTNEFARGIVWYEFHGFYTSLKHTEMKIRSKM